jgi:Trk K+ transport system NAD-binding subunit
MLVARWQVGPDLDGTPMRSLPTDVRVVCLTRAAGDVVNLPRRDTTLREGDLATLVGPYAELLGLLRGHARP